MDIILSNTSGKPIYTQITDQVKEQIMSGALTPGMAMPSMRLLARELHISVITTKRAYEDLEREGFLENIPGKGCFVAPQTTDVIAQRRRGEVETQLRAAVEQARRCGMDDAEVRAMLDTLLKEEPS